MKLRGIGQKVRGTYQYQVDEALGLPLATLDAMLKATAAALRIHIC